MPVEEYDKLSDSVLAWKRRNKLGRFDPNKDEKEQQELGRQYEEVNVRKITIGARCRVGGIDLDRRGIVRYIGEVDEIPNGGVWVGVETNEPTGKNDGTAGGKRYFECLPKHGSFVRPDRIEVGNFPVVDDLGDLEEI
jgi:tubulin-folding cofactor B